MTRTANASNKFGPSDFIVGPILGAGVNYSTIQSAINDANAAGGGIVYVRPGTYNENLTLFDKIQVIGAVGFSQATADGVTINGIHTPPSSGHVLFRNVYFTSATDVFFSNAAGTTHITVGDCESGVVNGYLFNLPNWTSAGTIEIYDHNPQVGAVNDGGVNNSGGAFVIGFNAGIGNGTALSSTISGGVFFESGEWNCPVTFGAGSDLTVQWATFGNTVTFSGNATGYIYFSSFLPSTGAAIVMNSSASIDLNEGIINSSNNPSLAGTGTGVLSYADLVFVNDTHIAGTLTTSTHDWKPYATTSTVGTSSFNPAQFTVTGAGQVSLISPQPIKTTTFNASGTWNIDPNCKYVQIHMWAGGAGGGGGGQQNAGTASSGGGGGSAGQFINLYFPASAIPASSAIVVGTGGTGGAGSASGNGTAGAVGTASSFVANSATIIATGGTGGLGGTSTVAGGGLGSAGIFVHTNAQGLANGGTGNSAGAGNNAGALTVPGNASGGGGGGGVSAGGTAFNGGAGGTISMGSQLILAGGTFGAAPGGNGGLGISPTNQPFIFGGTGGGGGAGSTVGSGGTGGNGNTPGAGGGGGGGVQGAFTGGNGGNGANGQVIIIEYF